MDAVVDKERNYSKEEEEKLKESFMLHKGFYLVWCGVISNNKILPIINTLMYLFHSPILIYSFWMTFFVEFEPALASEFAYFLLCVTCGAGFIIFTTNKIHFIRELVRQVTEGIYHYGDTLDPETAHMLDEMNKKKDVRKTRLMNGIELIFNSFFIGCVVALPWFGGKFEPKPEIAERYSNITDWYFNGQAMLVVWWPYDARDGWGWIISVISEYYIAFTILCLLDGMDLSFLGFAEEGCNQIQQLNLALQRLRSRAEYVYQKNYGKIISRQSKEYGLSIQECLKDSVQHHIASNRYFGNLVSAYSAAVFVVVLTGALMLCMSGIIFVSSKDTRQSVYDMDWTDNSKIIKPYIIMVQGLTNKPLRLSAGGIIYCSFDTFGNVVSSAYSYFNLLSASGAAN